MALRRSRRGALPPFIVMDVVREANQLAAAGRDIIHLELGQPLAGAAEPVRTRAAALLKSAPLGYTETLGIAPLRARIARHYRETYDVSVDPARVALTVGASGAFLLAFLACFDPGDRVGMAVPGYPSYRHILTALGVEPVLLETTAESRFQPTPALLDTLEPPLHGLVVASPANPTGTMLQADELEALAEWCRRRDVRLISDEIYHAISYRHPAASVLATDENAVVVSSFSKYYAMTGWRLGWTIVSPDLIRSVECIAQNFVISPPTLAQHAAVEAFDARSELDRHVARYRHNRDLLLAGMARLGWPVLAVPEGAFFLYVDIAAFSEDSLAFCRRVLAETGVAMTPGIDFDPIRGHRTIRLSFAGETEAIETAIVRLEAWQG